MGTNHTNFNKYLKICQGLIIFLLLLPFLVQAKCLEGQIDINQASLEELKKIEGIGPVKAQAIIDEREKTPFQSLDDLIRVKGIAEKTLAKIKDQGLACVSEVKEPEPSPIETPSETGEEAPSPAPKVNHPPIAQAGPDIIGLVNKEISFDASGSSDPNNDQLSFFWNFGDATTSDQIKPTHVYFWPGTYLVKLEVSDGKLSSSDTLEVKVYPTGLIISEFMPASPTGGPKDGWVEIFNQNEYVVDLSGFFLDAFQFPSLSLIGPKQFLVLKKEIAEGKVHLLYPEGSIAYKVSYIDPPQGQSSNWQGEEFFWSTIPTPGLANIISTQSPKNFNLSSLIKDTSYASPVLPTLYLENINNFATEEPSSQKITSLEGTSLESKGLVKQPFTEQSPSPAPKFFPLFTVICFGLGLILLTLLMVKCYYKRV